MQGGVATVTMRVTPKYARFYKNATMLLRPKTALEDMTIEVSPGTPAAGKLHSGETLPIEQTAPNIDFDEFLAGLDTETRFYLQALLAGAGEGLNHNGRALSATLKRFLPTTRLGTEITHELQRRHKNIARSIHNFRLLVEAVGGKDEQLAELVDASNAVFATFAKEDADFRRTLHLLPGALEKTGNELAKVKTASNALGIDADEAGAVREGAGAGADRHATSSRSRPRRSSRTRSARSRAKSCRSSTNSRPRPKTSPRPSRNSPSPSGC